MKDESAPEGDERNLVIRRWGWCLWGALVAVMFAGGAEAQGFPNVPRVPGELIAGPIAPEQGRTAIVCWHGDRIVSVPEAPGSQFGADLRIRVVNIEDLDGAGPQVTLVPASASGFHAHGYYHSGDYLYIGPHCLGESLDPCNGTYPHDVWGNAFRIGGAGTPIGDSTLRRADIDSETGLLLGSVQRAGAQSPWGLNDFWTYNAIGGDMWLGVRRNNEWIYDWGNGGAVTGPGVKAQWDHLGLTGVTGFPFIMGNILLVASDQAGSGVASYDISDLSNPVLLDVLKEGNPGGYWPEVYSHYIFFPRRDGEGGVGSQAGYMVVDFSDPTDLRVVANRNVEGSNQYVTFQDEYAFMNRYKIDMRTFDVALELETVPGVIDASQFALPVGNLVITGGYGSDGPGLAIFGHQAEPDTRGPYVAYHVPVSDQTNYPLECPITLSIPESLRTQTIIDGDTLILRPVGGSPVATWHAFGQGKLLTVTPQQPLLPDTTYEFILTSDIQDAAGNPMEPYSFRFSTGSGLSGGNQPPSVTSLTAAPVAPAPGEQVLLSWAGTDPDGDGIEFRLDLGDGSPLGNWGSATSQLHTYAQAGHYQVTVQVRDINGAVSAYSRKITVMPAPAAPGSTASAMMVVNDVSGRAYCVNPDNDTVAAIDLDTGQRLWESPVGRHPSGIALANDGSLWVSCRDSDSLDLLDESGQSLGSLPLDYGARPVAVCATPDGASMLVSLEGGQSLARYAVASRASSGSVSLGPWPRAIAITADGSRALVTRFISGEHTGSVYDVSLGGGMSLSRVITLARDHSVDGAASGRGVPNYLAGIRISPDGGWAWVVGKKDNTTRGTFFAPSMVPGQDSTVRAVLMLINLAANAESLDRRFDIDNSESPSAVAFSPLGDYAFITLQGNNQVGVIDVLDFMDVNSPGAFLARWGTGLAPQSIELAPASSRVVVKNFMDRSLSIFDAADFLLAGSLNVPVEVAETVAHERLHPEVLRGKQVFYNAADTRMSAEGYISCASCHIDGSHDGRTWDFTNRGEGFRNTTDLRGRSGMGHGNVHWSANFDEIQDFENDIRAFFGGSGFLSDSEHAATADPLGAPKAGLNDDLDALAAYVSSLGSASLPRNPAREPDGDLDAAALRGLNLFLAEGCATCHVPQTGFTDGLMHDVGTMSALSGQRLGGALPGIETPTLLGIEASAPYFHDGSASTLAEVFTRTGGRRVQAEDATLSGGATAEDVPWFPMKEWHQGAFVEIEGPETITFDDIETTQAGPGYIDIRYSLRYAAGQLNVVVNGAAPIAVPIAQTPNEPGYVPSEWRRVTVPITYQPGLNTIALSKAWGGSITIDDVLFSTPDDAQRASAHRRSLDPADLADLVAYIGALDGSNAAQPAVIVRREVPIPVGSTDALLLPSQGVEHSVTYTIENPGLGTLDLGAFHVVDASGGNLWIAEQPAAQVLPGESTTMELRVLLTAASATATLQGASNAPGVDTLHWNIAADWDANADCDTCLRIEAAGPTNLFAAVGDNAHFRIQAEGGGPLEYQWYRELPGKALIELEDGNGPELVLLNVQFEDSGSYFCIVQDDDEMEQGPTFQLTVVQSVPASGVAAQVIMCLLIGAASLAILHRRRKI